MRFLLVLLLPAILVAAPVEDTLPAAIKYSEHHPNPYVNTGFVDPEYELIDGDILVHPGDDWPPLLVGGYNALVNKDRLWDDGIIYYTVEPDTYTEDQIRKIEAGVEDLVNSTMVDGEFCVRIRKLGDEGNPAEITNWVLIGKYGGCSSALGQRPGNGSQSMSLVDSCIERHGTIMHEFLHAFGFYHEHQRGDRDDYVIINWDNIQSGTEGNFVKLEDGVTIDHLDTHYDYGSVMHYHAYSFAVNDTIPTIIPTDPDAEIGQRTHMSECDIERVQLLYGCIQPEDASDCV